MDNPHQLLLSISFWKIFFSTRESTFPLYSAARRWVAIAGTGGVGGECTWFTQPDALQ